VEAYCWLNQLTHAHAHAHAHTHTHTHTHTLRESCWLLKANIYCDSPVGNWKESFIVTVLLITESNHVLWQSCWFLQAINILWHSCWLLQAINMLWQSCWPLKQSGNMTVLLVTESNHVRWQSCCLPQAINILWQSCWLLKAITYCDSPVGFCKQSICCDSPVGFCKQSIHCDSPVGYWNRSCIVTVLLATESNHILWQSCWLMKAIIYFDSPVGYWKRSYIVRVLLVTESNHILWQSSWLLKAVNILWQSCWLLKAIIYCDSPVGYWKQSYIVTVLLVTESNQYTLFSQQFLMSIPGNNDLLNSSYLQDLQSTWAINLIMNHQSF
jgi:hypothetical protein